ncbi:Oidioi.mRNA.OKI2018_I69.XSR.g13295.t1.cds [Oikopleura dioica]|uniref:Oidioi.mRNA.OKI2018_I69.XSR.g13295.t1.cds n=1 Tax=Oikopleura dioica TaxID=34765 RepID=A0ABN7S6X7_OIKDI|nr:Oidioi.mRNA.OKI2018_I69.XSR.g13295.t1.cds [Oikopleura dioica]
MEETIDERTFGHLRKSQFVGNDNGSKWSDVQYKGRPIRRITLWCGAFLDAVKVDYDIKLGIGSQKHGTGRDHQRQNVHIHQGDHVQQVTGKTCDFYGQVILTEVRIHTEQGRVYGPFGNYDEPERELTPFAVGGPHCRLQYLDGKCERNDKEEWITQLGFNWEFLLEDESYYTGMSTFSSRAPSSFQMDLLGDNTTKKGLYQCISTTSVGNLSHSEESSLNQSDPKMLAEMLLKQIRCEGQQIRQDIERHKQNYLSISNNPQSSPLKADLNSKAPICKLCLQVDGAKVALICQGCQFSIFTIFINFKM